MFSMSETNLRPLADAQHLTQSVKIILLTPIGSRVLRRDFGSDLNKYVDEPVNDATAMAVRVATVEALLKWEPRIAIDRVSVDMKEGAIDVHVEAHILETHTSIKIDDIRVAA